MRKADPLSICLSTKCCWPLLLLLVCLLPASASSAELTPQQERGKVIYHTGNSPTTNERITAYFGSDRIAIPAETSPCASCHGYDGTGRPESGLTPANITWKFLTKSYGHLHPKGAKHSPFTEQSLKDYLQHGTYPGSSTGDPSMPVYDFSEIDLDDLVAFLKLLGSLQDPGLSDETIRIGTVLPNRGAVGEIGLSMQKVLAAYFTEINKQGGLYGRKIELAVLPAAAPNEWRRKAAAAAADKGLFALLSTFTPGLDLEYQSSWADADLPLVGPFTLYPLNKFEKNRQAFFLFTGLLEQIQVLLQFWEEKHPGPKKPLAVIYQEKPESKWLIQEMETDLRSRGWDRLRKIPSGNSVQAMADTLAVLQREEIALLIFLGEEKQARAFLQAAARENFLPDVLMPGALAGSLIVDADPKFANRLYLAYPSLAIDRQQVELKEFLEFLRIHQIKPAHLQAQTTAFVAAQIMMEGLRRSGRQLDRRKFITELENLYKFETGLAPSISYSRNRRIGALGAHVVEFQIPTGKNSNPTENSKWVDLGK